MAVPFQVQIGRISRFLSKWASTKGSSPVITIGSEVTPVLPLWSGVENRFLDSWNRFAITAGQAGGGAGTFAAFRLRNPTGSNVIEVIELILLLGSGGDTPALTGGLIGTDLATPANANALDTRNTIASSVAIFSRGTPAVATGLSFGLMQTGIPAANTAVNLLFFENQEIPLLPGSGLQITSQVANQALTASFFFRERSLEESERQ